MPLKIGNITVPNRVLLAPMSGISDWPFRAMAHRFGAGLVVCEMIASKELVRKREDCLLRARKLQNTPYVIQLAGREAKWMAEGARFAESLGADVIDINMGCPAKHVTKGLSGSALMRDPDHALELIEAVVKSVDVPVSLKMRMGWDDNQLNAPQIACRAEEAGVQMVTIHGRTRCQFFRGKADWAFIAKVKKAVSIPVIANGDVRSVSDAEKVLRKSGADGVMVGRGACGAPWLPGRIAEFLEDGRDPEDPPLDVQRRVVLEQFEQMLSHYGLEIGSRCARKHFSWYVEKSRFGQGAQAEWRRRLCGQDDVLKVKATIQDFYEAQLENAA